MAATPPPTHFKRTSFKRQEMESRPGSKRMRQSSSLRSVRPGRDGGILAGTASRVKHRKAQRRTVHIEYTNRNDAGEGFPEPTGHLLFDPSKDQDAFAFRRNTNMERSSSGGQLSRIDRDPAISPTPLWAKPDYDGGDMSNSVWGSFFDGTPAQSPEIARPGSDKDDGMIFSTQAIDKHAGGYICECCPKKPKKFDSEMELQ
jgi:hypothetical protein